MNKNETSDFAKNQSVFSQKSKRRSNKKYYEESINKKCSSVRKFSTKGSKNISETKKYLRMKVPAQTESTNHERLKKKHQQKKDKYYGSNLMEQKNNFSKKEDRELKLKRNER